MHFKFGDVIENGYASLDNPQRKGIYIRRHAKGLQMTDGKGNYWVFGISDKLTKVDNVLKDDYLL